MILSFIQGLRGLLSIGICVMHVKHYFIMYKYDPTIFGCIPDYLSCIIWGFFIISGYFMAGMVDNATPNFLPRRMVRIYPIYYVAIIMAFAFRYFTAHPLDAKDLGKVILLLPLGSGLSYKLNVEWTLVYEISFYIVCAVFSRPSLARYFPQFLVCWLGGILASELILPVRSINTFPTFINVFLSFVNFSCVCGALGYYYLRRSKELKVKQTAAGILIVSVIASFFLNPQSNVILYTSIIGAIVIMLLIKYERQTIFAKFLDSLGDSSYSLYLIHTTVIIFVLDNWHWVSDEQPALGAGLLIVAICLFGTHYMGKFDMGLYNYLKRKLNQILPNPKKKVVRPSEA